MSLKSKVCPQVLLLPNFTMIVTSALRELDGFDTIDLFEQALHVQVCMCVRAFAQHNVCQTVCMIQRVPMWGVSARPKIERGSETERERGREGEGERARE
jgi:hypothetical protein